MALSVNSSMTALRAHLFQDYTERTDVLVGLRVARTNVFEGVFRSGGDGEILGSSKFGAQKILRICCTPIAWDDSPTVTSVVVPRCYTTYQNDRYRI